MLHSYLKKIFIVGVVSEWFWFYYDRNDPNKGGRHVIPHLYKTTVFFLVYFITSLLAACKQVKIIISKNLKETDKKVEGEIAETRTVLLAEQINLT